MINFHLNKQILEHAKSRYLDFLNLSRSDDFSFKLTPLADPSTYATCFWIFGMHLLKQNDLLHQFRDELADSIFVGLQDSRNKMQLFGKAYRQLLAFSLSALFILGKLNDKSLEGLIVEQLTKPVKSDLISFGALNGKPQSGNQAMFTAVFLIFARDYLGLNVTEQIEEWIRLHKIAMNRFGLWGKGDSLTDLQIQNGYHQYEIFEYLGISSCKVIARTNALVRLAHFDGHFGPYPGGGGCFDYDAVFLLTPNCRLMCSEIAELLKLTATTILSEQNNDGGFCESLYVRPRSVSNTLRNMQLVFDTLPEYPAFIERFRYALALQRRHHDKIKTHWSTYSRKWNESNLWDSWFRMLAIARIDCSVDNKQVDNWGFINFPGIGFHANLKMI